jgi:hypothetical protein
MRGRSGPKPVMQQRMRSDIVKQGFERAPLRSLLKATGQICDDCDFEKPFSGVCNSYIVSPSICPNRTITLQAPASEIERQLQEQPPVQPKIKGGYLERYSYFVTSAQGAVRQVPRFTATPVPV